MKRMALASVLLIASAVGYPGAEPKPDAKPDARGPKTHQVKLNGHAFTLPEGFDIELVAGPPLVNRPIVADFDEEGRLYVADSSGSNEPVKLQVTKKPHRIVRLEDTKGAGKFDRASVFVDRIMFPEGAMWHAGSLYVAAPPSIWKFTDADGDGVAEKQEEWFQGKTLTGCANDLHGPYLGPDGWIYWCKGAFAKQEYQINGKPFKTTAAHIFRCRVDGTGLEPVMTGGMDNPVDVVFTPGGERIFTTTFFQHPAGGKRDGLIHAVYGGIYGKDHQVIYDHPWTSPALMPVLTHLGAAAPCGLHRFESQHFGPEYKDNLFACLFNMHKVTRHVLTPDGASFKSKDEDFLVSDNLDFHPTDVLEDADGSLLVLDTGGWYKLCCPTSQLQKPDVLGAIYRIRRTGAPKVDDPRGRKLEWAKLKPAELAKLLDDPRPAVRRRAIETLASKGAEAVPALREVRSAEARRNAIWTATRIDHASARELVREAISTDDPILRQAALHSINVWRDKEATRLLVDVLQGKDAHNARAAAEALGRIGDRAAVPHLLDALRQPSDRTLEHSLIYALIEIEAVDETAKGLASDNARVRRGTLIALDQMNKSGLKPEMIAKDLAAPNPALKEAAWWIAGRHPEWGGQLAGFLRDRLTVRDLKPTERDEVVAQLARFAGTPAVQEMLAARVSDTSAGDTRKFALQAMAQANLKEAPAGWIEALISVLGSNDSALQTDAVTTARRLRVPKPLIEKLTVALVAVANDPKTPVAIRIGALAAIPGGLAKVQPDHFALLRSQLSPEQPVAVRSLAADVLARARLSSDQLIALTESLKTAGPMEVERLLEAYVQSTEEKVGMTVIASLKNSASRSSLRTDAVKNRLAKYPARVGKEAESLYEMLNADRARQRARLEELVTTLKDGDIRRGQAVFNSTKAACSSCHAIGYLGGNIGPDLTRIGGIRTERDLLEAIVFPSASFVRSFEPTAITTKDGKTYNGLIRKDAPDEILLVLGANQEVRIPRDQIEDMLPSKVSIMPAGLDQQLSPRELADLVAFLRACK
jgi:putative membrane-bound dehydrogenase-like protein